MWYVYALELAFALAFAADIALFCYLAVRIKNHNLRALWIATIGAHVIPAGYISMQIADRFNVTDPATRRIFLLFLLIQGGGFNLVPDQVFAAERVVTLRLTNPLRSSQGGHRPP